jgi:putative hydrolase of the HAD superfamily
LGRPLAEAPALREEFFAGDVLDRELLDFIRMLRPSRRTGVISNAWADMRDYMIKNRFDDAFDFIVISAEVGLLKPDAGIYELACRGAGVAPADALLVDDLPANVEGAVAAGMTAILFEDTDQVRRQLAKSLR